jgi:hypothetical protein
MSQVPTQSYLLRLWREQEAAPLRATLIAVAQPEAPPRHFASLAALYAYLRDLAGQTSGTTDEPNDAHCTSSQTD